MNWQLTNKNIIMLSFNRCKIKSNIPNLLTLFNLVCGSMGIIIAFQGNLFIAASLIKLGAFFDFLDGLIARALGAHSSMGKELDSLADLITFGLLPTVVIYHLLQQGYLGNQIISPYIALLIVICAALRLAKFNVASNQKDKFIGLSTTGYAILISTLPPMLLNSNNHIVQQFLATPYCLAIITIIGPLLQVSNMPFMALKFNNEFRWSANKSKYLFILIAILLTAIFREEGIAISMVIYITMAFILQCREWLKIN